jgi:hypothetical protein
LGVGVVEFGLLGSPALGYERFAAALLQRFDDFAGGACGNRLALRDFQSCEPFGNGASLGFGRLAQQL